MKNQIFFGDNLSILKKMPSDSVELIYIDPPFNTGKVQSHTKIKTIKSDTGSRRGFQGNSYETIELGTKTYQDSFDSLGLDAVSPEIKNAYQTLTKNASVHYLEVFLEPRLREAHRILKSYGSLYFHIDYRESHYCKILLDRIFGRECFLNEIIWAYDFGGRSKSRWPAKHDTILYYVKDPKNYIFNTSEIDREDYMAPGLVGFEKAEQGKLPTDTWWFSYVGRRYVGKRVTDTWWQTIVGTNSRERIGYPTQKPHQLLDRIIKASSHPGNLVLDFFAGSGTVGKSCIDLNRNFILIDENQAALEVMAKRFSGNENIEWVNFDPTAHQPSEVLEINEANESPESAVNFSSEFQMLAATASYIQKDLEEQSDLWKNSPFEWVLQLPARKKGKLGRQLLASWLATKGISSNTSGDASETLIIKDYRFAIKFSTIWTNGIYKFQQIRPDGYDYIICLGISPFEAHCWIFDREYAITNAQKQHKTAEGAEYWITIDPQKPKDWILNYGGSLNDAYKRLKKVIKK
jgi:site-specific DNA-methyltransferase (adenine-specific)